jgi:hypothetical protein
LKEREVRKQHSSNSDLFEHALEKCPAKFACTIYLLYAKFEEDYGLLRHALRVYDRAVQAVEKKDLLAVRNDGYNNIVVSGLYNKDG